MSTETGPSFQLAATDLASFVRLQFCSRYLAFQAGKGQGMAEEVLRRHEVGLDPTFQEMGLKAEEEWARGLEAEGFRPVEAESWEGWKLQVAKATPRERLYARQVALEGSMGRFHLKGRMDFLLLDWKRGEPLVRVVEAKATRKDRTHHYVQLALYALLVEEDPPLWQGQRVPLEFMVVRMDPGTRQPESPLCPLRPEELELLAQAKEDVQALLAPGSPVEAALEVDDPLALPYNLNARCDACPFSSVCLLKGQERGELELLGLKGDVLQALREGGISDLEALATATPEVMGKILRRMESPPRPEHLQTQAKARLAPLVFPQKRQRLELYPVMPLRETGFGHLPPYAIEGKPLLRVYLAVEPDLLEERINGLAAHIAVGEGLLDTGEEGNLVLQGEQVLAPGEESDQGWVVVELRQEPWAGDPRLDDQHEGELLSRFFNRLVESLRKWVEAGGQGGSRDGYPLHFYVWSPTEIRLLVEAALRAGAEAGGILQGLWHLMGCREGLEQLLFSSLKDEVANRYALGYTSRSLLSAVGLPWLLSKAKGARPFPWKVDGIDLRRLFRPWVFDFVTRTEQGYREVRSRNYETLPPIYWRAFWGYPPKALAQDPKLERSVSQAAPHVPRYLAARSLALRWLEERIQPKNRLLRKPLLDIRSLPDFRLRTNPVSRVALDFLRFEQEVRLSLWLADKTLPPELRVLNGTALLLEGLEWEDRLRARIKPHPPGIPLSELETRVAFSQGDFVRVSPLDKTPDQPQKPQTLLHQGLTAVLKELDWQRGEVSLEPIPAKAGDHYVLRSSPFGLRGGLAVMDASPSDYVARRVDQVLSAVEAEHPLNLWFDPENPGVPPIEPRPDIEQKAREVLEALVFRGGQRLNEIQKAVLLEGFSTRIHLLQGPPGTGKTQVTAVALHLWAQLLLPHGGTLGVVAATHTAVDTLLERVLEVEEAVRSAFVQVGLPWKEVAKLRLDPPKDGVWHGASVSENLSEAAPRGRVLFGTTNALLKQQAQGGSSLDLLVVDEASMMLFPHFLALVTNLSLGGNWQVMLAGDHRQLSPVIQHQWSEEDRPGVQRYLPYLSAFEALLRLREMLEDPDPRIRRSALDYTHRLPEDVRSLIQPLYQRDGVILKGRPTSRRWRNYDSIWKAIWSLGEGVYLLTHNEASSRKRNPLEAEIICRVLEAASGKLNPGQIAVVTPFRAHRTLLRERLGEAVGLVDTVERLQGGERELVFYSACASDPSALSDLQEFLLDVNRTNVAFSRAKERLVVVVSENLLNYIPPEREGYTNAVLWKALRRIGKHEVGKANVSVGERTYQVRLRVPWEPKEKG